MKASNPYHLEWKETPIWLRVILIIALINFASFWIISVANGGDASNGKKEDGRFFVANHGRYTEVSSAFFECNRIQSISVWVTHSCALLGVVWFFWRRKEHGDGQKRKTKLKLLPCDSFEIVTTLSPSKLVTVFQRHVVPFIERHNVQYDVHFFGRVDEKGFKCRPAIRYRNGFLPVVIGSFRSIPEGTTVIHVAMRPDFFTVGFLVVWFGIPISGIIFGIFSLPNSGLDGLKTVILLGGMVFISWAFIMFFFWLEGKKVQPLLAHAIPCQTTPSQSKQ